MPGLEMSGAPGGFPSAIEFADHLDRYFLREGIRAEYGVQVKQLFKDGATFVAELVDGELLRTRVVINATGSNQQPSIPAFSKLLSSQVLQIPAVAYRAPYSLVGRSRVLVVGDGATGRQIALELAHAGHEVSLARGRKRKLVPNVMLGRDVFWWLNMVGVLRAPTGGAVASILRKRDPIPAASANDAVLNAIGVHLQGRASDASVDHVTFSDGHKQAYDAIIWAAGYREDNHWISPEIKVQDQYIGMQGLTPEPGLFVIGRKWLFCRASELVLGVEADARAVVEKVERFVRIPVHERNTQITTNS
jgi:putative flavoprotein involved in K+ transport